MPLKTEKILKFLGDIAFFFKKTSECRNCLENQQTLKTSYGKQMFILDI